jgi:polar amino acid transport system substrate-binding protein
MRHPRSGRWLIPFGVTVAVLVMVLVAAGCGSSNSSSNTSPSTSSNPLHALLPASVISAGQIRVASDIPYPPWEMNVGTTTQVTGFDYDLSQAIGVKLGIKVTFNQTKFDSIILTLQSGKNDVAMSDMYDNKTRQKVLDFVDYANDGTSILVAKGNPQKVTNLDSLAGKTVVCERGTTQAVLLQNLNKTFKSAGKSQMTILQLPDQPSALLKVGTGAAVGDLTDHSTAEYIAHTQAGGAAFDVVADPAAPNGYDPQLVGAGILKSNTALLSVWQKALQDLITGGAYQKIVAAYGLVPVTSAQTNQGAMPASASPSP